MTLFGVMEIFQRRPELQQLRNSFMLHQPPFRHNHPRLMQQPPFLPPPAQPEKPTTSFLISDILSGNVGKPASREEYNPVVRPWDSGSSRSSSPEIAEDEEIDVGEERPKTRTHIKGSPLDALFKMTNKSFDGKDSSGLSADGESQDQMSGLFSKAQPSKKRRKSRTAFSNHQIYELEKRFLYQKYLTPADRDEIAQQLGLSNAQVITWFQNRRAKLKRDLEELKADVSAAKVIGKDPPNVLTRLEEMQAYTTRQSLIKWEKRTLKMKGECPSGFNPLSILDDHPVPLNMVHSPDKRSEDSHCADKELEMLPKTPVKSNDSVNVDQSNEQISHSNIETDDNQANGDKKESTKFDTSVSKHSKIAEHSPPD